MSEVRLKMWTTCKVLSSEGKNGRMVKIIRVRIISLA